MKKYLSMCLTLVLIAALFTISPSASAQDMTDLDVQKARIAAQFIELGYCASNDEFFALENAYRQCTVEAETAGRSLDISLESFIWNYQLQNAPSVETYLEFYLSNIDQYSDITQTPRWGGGDYGKVSWQYNTGTTLPRAANYTKYDMTTNLTSGDVFVEDDAFSSGLVGHAGIVEGKFYSSTYQMYYIRVIEAVSPGGVCRGVYDDDRVDIKNGDFFRLKNFSSDPDANLALIDDAVQFMKSQFGKPWEFWHGAGSSANQSSWYCSELVWAAYKNQRVDLVFDDITRPGIAVTPDMLRQSGKLRTVGIS